MLLSSQLSDGAQKSLQINHAFFESLLHRRHALIECVVLGGQLYNFLRDRITGCNNAFDGRRVQILRARYRFLEVSLSLGGARLQYCRVRVHLADGMRHIICRLIKLLLFVLHLLFQVADMVQ